MGYTFVRLVLVGCPWEEAGALAAGGRKAGAGGSADCRREEGWSRQWHGPQAGGRLEQAVALTTGGRRTGAGSGAAAVGRHKEIASFREEASQQPTSSWRAAGPRVR